MSIKTLLIESTEKVIAILNLGDDIETNYTVQEIIENAGLAPFELSDISDLVQIVGKKLCPHCSSIEGINCSCNLLERI